MHEMASLFNTSELYHIGGDETRCSGSGDFLKKIVACVENGECNNSTEGDREGGKNEHTKDASEKGMTGQRAVVWSDAAHTGSAQTVVQTWKSPNASTLAVNGNKGTGESVYAVESAPNRQRTLRRLFVACQSF